MPSTVYRSCPLCEATCGLAITTERDRVVGVRGDADDPFSRGYVCPKAAALADLHDDPDRLQRPVVRDDQIVIRPMMYVALTYDHRLIDGREAVLFLVRVKDCIEDPQRLLLEV